ncbi:hypothetical protein BT69DRAFT_1253460 [Atractiella rhizophila]|nr:hypothetical protein BT69DRAFT_1253460 [Atractiella rhizophila]
MSTTTEQEVQAYHPLAAHERLPNGSKYPLIDNDPHFFRVLRYFRFSDYVTIAAGTLAGPALLFATLASTPGILLTRRSVLSANRVATALGASFGFSLAYNHSSFRFMGLRENRRELIKDHEELSARHEKGLPLWGKSTQSEFIQRVAHANSIWGQFIFHIIPIANFVNHPYHGVDPAKYGRPLEIPEELYKKNEQTVSWWRRY